MRLTGGATPGWQPLPECDSCEAPMRRTDYRRQGGVCRTCRPAGPEHPLAVAERTQLEQWQALAARRGAQERQAAEERARRRTDRLRARRASR